MSQPRDKACAAFGDQLTAYLDGELAGDRVSAVRGHLRECDHCRQAADELAALRDGLRALAPVDPPPTMWAGVQAKLAAAEVADAHRSSWRRALTRWLPAMPRFGGLALATAAIAALLWWRTGRHLADTTATTTPPPATVTTEVATAQTPTPTPVAATSACDGVAAQPIPVNVDDDTADVAIALAADPARTAARYTAAVDELLGLACGSRAAWTDSHRATFDTGVAKLRAEVAAAAPGRTREHAWRALVHYLQTTVVRDEVASIDGDRGALAGTRGTP